MGLPRLSNRALALLLVAGWASILVGAAAVLLVVHVARAQDEAQAAQADRLVATARLGVNAEEMTASTRGFLLMHDERSLSRLEHAKKSFHERLATLRSSTSSREEIRLLSDIEDAGSEYVGAVDALIAAAQRGDSFSAKLESAQPVRDKLLEEIQVYRSLQDEQWRILERLEAARARRVILGLSLTSALMLAAAVYLGLLLYRAYRQLFKARRALQEHAERLEMANRDLDAFAGRIAHDIRNSLGPISMATQILDRQPSEPIIRQSVATMKRTLARVLSMLEGLLEFSRAGRPAHRHEAASLRDAVKDAFEEQAVMADEAGVRVEHQIEEVRVACDGALLQVVIGNLLHNALKFIKRSSKERRIFLGTRQAGEWGELIVQDTGPGIPSADIRRIFEPFFRGSSGEPGTGIGLATVQRIIISHGGHIDVESVVGQGTTFRVSLPLASSGIDPGQREAADLRDCASVP